MSASGPIVAALCMGVRVRAVCMREASELALMYNDESVLESHHLAVADPPEGSTDRAGFKGGNKLGICPGPPHLRGLHKKTVKKSLPKET